MLAKQDTRLAFQGDDFTMGVTGPGILPSYNPNAQQDYSVSLMYEYVILQMFFPPFRATCEWLKPLSCVCLTDTCSGTHGRGSSRRTSCSAAPKLVSTAIPESDGWICTAGPTGPCNATRFARGNGCYGAGVILWPDQCGVWRFAVLL